jgi:phospholipid/cholesterol/gamma-HCH transport system substrate-binding protein
VSRLSFAGENSTAVLVQTSVNPDVPLKKDVRASLGFQGLTGVAYVSLNGGTRESPSLFADGEVPTIVGERSAFEDLLEGARDIMKKADSTLTTIDKVVNENAPAINNTIQNVDKFSQALAANSDAVQTFFADVSKAANTIADLSDRLQSVVGHVETLVNEVKPEQVREIVDNAVKFSDALGNAGARVDALMADLSAGSDKLQRFLDGLNASLASVDEIIAAVPSEAIRRIVENADRLSTNIAERMPDIDAFIERAREAAANIDRISGTIANRSDDIDVAITNVRSLTDRIDQLATGLGPVVSDAGRILDAVDPERVDAIVRNVETVTGRIAAKTGEIDQTIDDVRAAAGSARKFAENIEAHSGDVDKVVAETRQLMDRLNGAAARIGGILDKVDALVEGDGQGLVAEATRAARAIRIVAENFEPQSRTIANGLGRFSSTGLSELTATFVQARETLATIQNAVNNLERDPSRVLFGGSGQPTYRPQRR